jgi:hypothetical protein
MISNCREIYLGTSTNKDLEKLVEEISKLFNTSFNIHDSSYYGGIYYRGHIGTIKVVIQRNADGYELALEDFPDMNILVKFNVNDDAENERIKSIGFKFLWGNHPCNVTEK